MTDYATLTAYNRSVIGGGDDHDITFRPDRAGHVVVSSKAVDHPSPVKSESGFLAKLELFHAGSDTAIASAGPFRLPKPADLPGTYLRLVHDATDGELATAGDWKCRVTNETDVGITFETDIAYVSNFVLEKASFDTALLSLLLDEVSIVAGIRVHLMTSPGNEPLSCATWSSTLAQNLLHGKTSYRFHLPEFAVTKQIYKTGYYIHPVFVPEHYMSSGPVRILLNPDERSFDAQMEFGSVTLDSPNHPDLSIALDALAVTVHVHFDGSVSTGATATAAAHVKVHGEDVYDQDVSSDVESGVPGGVAGFVGQLTPPLKQRIDDFFVQLLRLTSPSSPGAHSGHVPAGQAGALGPQGPLTAHIQEYAIDGGQLVVRYYLVQAMPPAVAVH